jgi:hypothetical protein
MDIASRFQPLMARIARVSTTISSAEKGLLELVVDGVGRAALRDQREVLTPR